MSYGYTSEGLQVPAYAELLAKFYEHLETTLGITIDKEVDGGFGELAEITAYFYLENWEFLEVFHQQFKNPEGEFLDIKAAFAGLSRNDPTKSQADIVFFGAEATAIPIGTLLSSIQTLYVFETTSAFAIEQSRCGEILFTIEAPFVGRVYTFTIDSEVVYSLTAASEGVSEIRNALMAAVSSSSTELIVAAVGTDQVVIKSTQADYPFSPEVNTSFTIDEFGTFNTVLATLTGNLEAPTDYITAIDTPVSGLDRVYNPLPAQRGKGEETDYELKLRTNNQRRVVGGGSTLAIQSKIIENVAGVSWCKVFENTLKVTSPEGLPATSIAVVLEGGDNTEIAEAIDTYRAGGIEAWGNINVIVADSEGISATVGFSRPTPKYAWIKVSITAKNYEEAFPLDGLDAIKENLYNFAKVDFDIGDDFIPQKLFAPIYQVPGIKEVTIEIGATDTLTPPVVYVTSTITILPTEYLTFEKSSLRILVIDAS